MFVFSLCLMMSESFSLPQWSDTEETENYATLPETNSVTTNTVLQNGNSISHKRRRAKKKPTDGNKISGAVLKVNSSIKGSVMSRLAISDVKRADKLLNSPSLTQSLMNNSQNDENEQKTLKGKNKTKKGKKQHDYKQMHSQSKKDRCSTTNNVKKQSSVSSLSEAVAETTEHIGSILRRGLKFSSESEFLNFMKTKPKKHKRAKKKKKIDNNEQTEEISNFPDDLEDKQPVPSLRKKRKACQLQNGFETSNGKSKKGSLLSNTNPFHPEYNPDSNDRKLIEANAVHPNFNSVTKDSSIRQAPFDIEKLSNVFKENDKKLNSALLQENTPSKDGANQNEDSAAKLKLKSSRFRFLNEKLYTQTGGESFKMFKCDSEGKQTFKIYHQGYAEQIKKWPMDPLDLIIRYIYASFKIYI